MTHSEWQEYEEFYVVIPILDQLGLSTDTISGNRDKPDVRITLNDGRLIGIEVTQYVVTKNKKAQDALYKLFKEYSEKHLPLVTKETFQVSVMFWNVDFPAETNLKSHKEDIFREIDSFLPGREPLKMTRFVEGATFFPSPNIPNFTSELLAFENMDVNEEYLISLIRNKEKKIDSYKQNPKSAGITEYWLAINVGFEENTDFREYQLPNTFTSYYSRIYLVETNFCKRIYPLNQAATLDTQLNRLSYHNDI